MMKSCHCGHQNIVQIRLFRETEARKLEGVLHVLVRLEDEKKGMMNYGY